VQHARYIVSGNKKPLGEREPRRRGVGTCCFRFAGAEEGVTERIKGWEKEGGIRGRPLFVHCSAPASTILPDSRHHWRSIFPTLLYFLSFPSTQDKFSHIFEKTCYTLLQKDNAKTRPFLCNSLHRFLKLLFREALWGKFGRFLQGFCAIPII